MLLPIVMFDERTPGLAPTISRLGMVGFVAFSTFTIQRYSIAWYFSLIGVITIAASGARAPFVGAVVSELLQTRRAKIIVLLVGLFVITTVSHGDPGRLFSLTSIRQHAEVRLATASISIGMDSETYRTNLEKLQKQGVSTATASSRFPPVIEPIPAGSREPIYRVMRGVGINSHHAAVGWPRPHNIFTLIWRELGLLIIAPLFLIYLAYKRRYIGVPLLVSIAVYGLLDDSIVSSNGQYGIAIIVLVDAMIRKFNYAR